MDTSQLVRSIVEREHMGEVNGSYMEFSWRGVNILRLSWDSTFEGKVVRQYAEFKFTSISLGDGEGGEE